jgi:3-isopropylmalate/(R)-2-methylmalate dehydratase small subunit
MSTAPMIGRAFVVGDNIDTDLLAPGAWMKLPPAELAQHCLEAVDPTFATQARSGDFLVAGRNFGLGSSREQAAQSLKLLGVAAVLAPSFARIFYRNAINLGLPALILRDAGQISAGDRLRVDLDAGRVDNLSQDQGYAMAPMPAHLQRMIEEGGLIAHLKRRFAASATP